MENIYFFDPLVALKTAKRHQTTDTNLQTNQEQICFYNGEVFANMPSNCISVPINNFYNYFFTTTHSLPQQINFDNQAFNNTTKQEITQSIVDTLTQVKEARIQIIVQVLQAPIQQETTPAYIILLLDYLQFIDVAPQEIEKEILYKLLDLVRFSINKQLTLPQELIEKVTTLFEFIQNRHSKLLKKNIKLMHLQYALYSLLTNNLQLDIYFKNLLQLLNDLSSIIVDYNLVTHVFTEAQLSDYLKRMNQALFSETFMSENILNQKQIIYKFFFLTNLIYGRGKAYQEMYYFLHPYFLKAIEKGLDELAFYLYTPLLMSWNGTVQTQKEFKKFNDEVEKPLESFISNSLISKYKLIPNNKSIDNNKPIKVAFLQERIINYSVHKVFYSLLKLLNEDNSKKYEFMVYDLNFMEFGGSDTSKVEELKKLGINYIDLHKECAKDTQGFYPIVDKSLKVRQKIIGDKIDILIGMNTRPEYNFLFTSRTVPKQIYWSHGNHMYDLNNIDSRITHIEDFAKLESIYKFHTFHVNNQHFYKTLLNSANGVEKERAKYPKESFILGTVGRLSKLDNEEYLHTIATILKANANTIYIAAGQGDKSSIVDKLKHLNITDKFFFPGSVNAAVYHQLIDICMNTFPFPQGESLNEFMATQKPFITLVKATPQWIEKYKNSDRRFLYPYSYETYIKYANVLIQNPKTANNAVSIVNKELSSHRGKSNDYELFISSICN